MEEVVGIVAGVIAVIGGLYQGYTWLKKKLDVRKAKLREGGDHSNSESVAKRFVRLFEAHGVYRNQIPEFIGHELTISDMQTEDSLLVKLTPSLLNDAAGLFKINPEWLSHGQGEIFELHHFYKHPAEFGQFLDQLLEKANDKEVEGFVLTVKPPRKHEEDTLIVMKEGVGRIGERTIYRYHLCPGWVLSYWKCCADVACCIAQAQMRDISLLGRYVEKDWLQGLAYGTRLPEFSFDMEDLHMPSTGRWQVDEFVDIPEKFLEPLPMDDGFSALSALERWLTYFDAGKIYIYSDTVNRKVGEAFKEKANKYIGET
jgi:hypothetical protein